MRSRTLATALVATLLTAGFTPPPTPVSTPTPTPSPTATPTASPSDGTLQILAFKGYIEYGGSTPKVNWTSDFQDTTGCRIARLDVVGSRAELEAALAKRPYDVFTAGPELAGKLIDGKRAQRLDTAKVSGYADLGKRQREQVTRGDHAYGVPFLWGSYETLYDSSRVKAPTAEALYTSPRAIVRDTPMTIGHAARAFGLDPAKLTPAQLDELAGRLAAGERDYWTRELEIVTGLATGKIDYAQATPYIRSRLQKAGRPVKRVKAERAIGWSDSWMMAAGTPNADCAYRWLSWIAAPATQAEAAAWTGLAPASQKGCTGAAAEVCRAYGKPAKVDFLPGSTGICAAQDRECTSYATWEERWRKVVG